MSLVAIYRDLFREFFPKKAQVRVEPVLTDEGAVAEAVRADADTPLGARIGSVAEFPRTLIPSVGSLLNIPTTSQMDIVAIGYIEGPVPEGERLVRLYGGLGGGAADEGVSFIELRTRGKQVLCADYYVLLSRRIPETAQELAPYQGEGFGLGEDQFWLADDILQAGGVPEEKIQALLGDQGALEFTRIESPGEPYVAPVKRTERIILDPTGGRCIEQEVVSMPYARTLEGGLQERLLLTCQTVQSVDGQPTDVVQLDYLVGIRIPPINFRVI